MRYALEVGSSPRSPFFSQMRRQTVPPEALLIRRMEGLLFSVLGELRAGAAKWATRTRAWAPSARPSARSSSVRVTDRPRG